MEFHGKGCGGEEELDLRRGPWTVDEDLILVNYIAVHGEGRWNSLARCAGTDLRSLPTDSSQLIPTESVLRSKKGYASLSSSLKSNRTEKNWKELPAPMAQLPSARRPARQHHSGGAAPHPGAPLPLGKPVSHLPGNPLYANPFSRLG